MSLARVRLVLWLLIAAVLIAASAYYGIRMFRGEPVGPQFGGPFSLTTTTGETFTQADLVGSPTLMFFGYTFCPDVCPTTLSESTAWRNALELTPDDLKIVFVTVDPQRDTAEQMALYLSSFDHVIGLTGSAAAIEEIKSGYGIFSEIVGDTGTDSYLVNHTASVFMIDATGDFTGTIAYGEARDTVLGKIERLVAR